jgi:hypothetical protein
VSGRRVRVKPVPPSVATVCPVCGSILTARSDRPSSRRKCAYHNHLRATHGDLPDRQRSLLADGMVRAEAALA